MADPHAGASIKGDRPNDEQSAAEITRRWDRTERSQRQKISTMRLQSMVNVSSPREDE